MANQKRIYTFILALVPNHQDADDLFQETVLLMWSKFDSFTPGTSFVAWGCTIARYQILSVRKRHSVRSLRFSEAAMELLYRESGPFAERTVIHGGRQSVPLDCNNLVKPFYSETSRESSPEQDWTVAGVNELAQWLRGNPVALAESATGTITMSAWGADIYGTADQCRFAYKPLTGNGAIVAKVESIGNSDPWAKGGIMIRESLDAGSRFAIVVAPRQGRIVTPSPGQQTLLPLGEASGYRQDTEMALLYAKYQVIPSLTNVNGPMHSDWFTHFPNSFGSVGPDRTIDYFVLSSQSRVLDAYVRQRDTLKISDHLPLVVVLRLD
jgi:RNA polymerase sigma factor (sigma-70 family)